MQMFDLNEKTKFCISFAIIFIIGVVGILVINNYCIKQISNNYMKQNMAIVGAVAKNDPKILDSIIPVITKGNITDYKEGEKILEKYSYNTDFSLSANALMQGEVYKNFIRFALFYFVIMALVFSYCYLKMSKIWNAIKSLSKKAELIVEGKLVSEKINNFNDGIMDGLNIQFGFMQNRIKSNIDDLNNEKLKLKQIINDISHQFKTPIAAMTMYTDILKDVKAMDEDEVEYFLEMTREQIGRMDWLVKTLLKYARLEGSIVEYKIINQSLNQTVHECIESLSILANEKNISITLNNMQKEIFLLHDRKWMQEAIMNIIKNAIEHTHNDGSINVSIEENDIFIKVKIVDNGEGISEADIPKIFNRFHKGSNSINPKSIGIGLSLSKNIVEANNGSIKAISKLGEGSEFIITFLK